jgi:hypothetical protein
MEEARAIATPHRQPQHGGRGERESGEQHPAEKASRAVHQVDSGIPFRQPGGDERTVRERRRLPVAVLLRLRGLRREAILYTMRG